MPRLCSSIDQRQSVANALLNELHHWVSYSWGGLLFNWAFVIWSEFQYRNCVCVCAAEHGLYQKLLTAASRRQAMQKAVLHRDKDSADRWAVGLKTDSAPYHTPDSSHMFCDRCRGLSALTLWLDYMQVQWCYHWKEREMKMFLSLFLTPASLGICSLGF